MFDGPAHVAVLGAGIAGLSTAFDLETRARSRGISLDVTVFESSETVGGKLRTILEDGYLVEEGPNGWLDNEPATARLLSRLGLESAALRSEDAARHRFILIGNRLRELPLSPRAFIKSDILSPVSKLRVAAELLIPPKRDLGRAAVDPATDETIFQFGQRRLGRDFAELLLDPMVKGIFGGDARRTSLAAAFPRMVELERDYGGLLRAMVKLSRQRRKEGNSAASPSGPGGTLTSLADGMAVLPQSLRDAVRAEVRTGYSVTDVWRDGDSWWLTAGPSQHGPYDAVIDATPAHAAAEHLSDAELSRLLAGIPYAPMAVVTLAFDRNSVDHPLHGFGMLNPSRERRRLLGVLWSTSIFKGRAPEGKVLLRCMAGGATNPDVMDLTDGELVQLCLDELGPLYGLKGDVERSWVIRHERAIAQYERGHLARLSAIAGALARLPGLFLTGSSYRGVSTNHCIAEAEKTADTVLDYLASRTEHAEGAAEPGSGEASMGRRGAQGADTVLVRSRPAARRVWGTSALGLRR